MNLFRNFHQEFLGLMFRGFNLILKERKLDESVGRFSLSCARGNIFEGFSFLFFAGSDFPGSA
jgi:hypothetical protein